ncbi:MAG: hypothetical protein PUG17_06460, partial [Stecheria intestinalis]|nr:hypothetical protein [Stecheria intestinalis]
YSSLTFVSLLSLSEFDVLFRCLIPVQFSKISRIGSRRAIQEIITSARSCQLLSEKFLAHLSLPQALSPRA